MDELWVCQLGQVEYREALELQERVHAARSEDRIPNTMIVLEHPSTITRGRRTVEGDLPLPESWYREQGMDIVDVNRGGKLTLHAPGQIVGYPILKVVDVVAYVRLLEQAIVSALFEQGVLARTRPEDGRDYTGVWVQDRKIASIGVHVAKGVTTHGFSLNTSMDMTPWTWFSACGLPTVTMTSVAQELGQDPDCSAELISCMRKRMGASVSQALGLRQRLVTPAALERALAVKNAERVGAADPGPGSPGQYAVRS